MSFSSAGFFKRGRTIALLKDVGTTDVDSDILIIVVIVVATLSKQVFNKVVGIGSSSQALHGAFRIIFLTSSTEAGVKSVSERPSNRTSTRRGSISPITSLAMSRLPLILSILSRKKCPKRFDSSNSLWCDGRATSLIN